MYRGGCRPLEFGLLKRTGHSSVARLVSIQDGFPSHSTSEALDAFVSENIASQPPCDHTSLELWSSHVKRVRKTIAVELAAAAVSIGILATLFSIFRRPVWTFSPIPRAPCKSTCWPVE